MTPKDAYYCARDNHTEPDFNLEHYQKNACKEPYWAYMFADIPGADIEYCQEHACKSVIYAMWFAYEILGADIEYCRKACEHNEYYLDLINQFIIKRAML